MIRFRNDDIIMTGDFFRSLGYPNIDRANGGSLNGMLDGLGDPDRNDGSKYEGDPGAWRHSRPCGDHRASRYDSRGSRPRGCADRAGKTQAEVLAANPTADYDAKIPTAADTKQRFVTQVYAELAPAK